MNLLYLFGNFFRIGFFAVGGGLATLPFLYEIAENSDWLTKEAVLNMLAVAQSAPGAIGVNLAAYTGFRHAAFFAYAAPLGALAASLGLVTPSIIIIVIIAKLLQRFKESKTVKSLFTGLRPAAAGLLSAAGFGAIVLSVWNTEAALWYHSLRVKETLLLALIFILIVKFKKHPILYIAAAGAVGMLLGL